MGAGRESLFKDRAALGLVFESLVVVTSTGRPYQRDDGVGVVPITALRP